MEALKPGPTRGKNDVLTDRSDEFLTRVTTQNLVHGAEKTAPAQVDRAAARVQSAAIRSAAMNVATAGTRSDMADHAEPINTED